MIRRRLKHRKVAVVGIGEVGLENLELFGNVGELACDPVDELAAEEEVALDPCPAAQVEIARVL